MIEFKYLSVSYSKNIILSNISGKIQFGKITAIIGPNGCGKSTLLKTLLGLIPKQSGQILINQKSIKKFVGKFYRLR